MPSLNHIKYIPDTDVSYFVLFNTVDDVDTATVVPTHPGINMAANVVSGIDGPWYYINNENIMTNGYIYTRTPYCIDSSKVYGYDDNTNTWSLFMSLSDCLQPDGNALSQESVSYFKYRYGYHDNEMDTWENTQRKICFPLAETANSL